jgi:hypothetical protein
VARKVWDDEAGKLTKRQPELAIDVFAPADDPSLEIVCPTCNARIGEQCASIVNASKTLKQSHAARAKAV